MNAERLYFLAKELQNEFERFDMIGHIEMIIDSLEKWNKYVENDSVKDKKDGDRNRINSIYTVKYNIDQILFEISSFLERSVVNYNTSYFSEEISDIFVSYEFGFFAGSYYQEKLLNCIGLELKNKLSVMIDDIFNKINSVNEKISFEKIVKLEKLQSAVKEAGKTISGIVSGLSFYENRKENVGNCCEIILIIPRQQVQENLKSLGQELISLEKNLSVFSEVATGSREPIRVKTIASSNFSIFLESASATGACIAVAVERIISLYKQSLEIKKIKLELEKHKAPDTISALLDNHINSIVSAAAEKIAAEVMEKHAARLEENRKNELLIELRHSIENLAEKIDKGFQIEVSVAELGEEKKETGGQLTADEIARKQIAESAKKITYPISSGEPVPALPEKEVDNGE